MNDKKILKKAIEKAVKNGYWDNWKTYNKYERDKIINSNVINEKYYSLIFLHDFAKAFWDEETIFPAGEERYWLSWKYHIRQMVLEPEPLKYLERFL